VRLATGGRKELAGSQGVDIETRDFETGFCRNEPKSRTNGNSVNGRNYEQFWNEQNEAEVASLSPTSQCPYLRVVWPSMTGRQVSRVQSRSASAKNPAWAMKPRMNAFTPIPSA
jgi:hypothetical protein